MTSNVNLVTQSVDDLREKNENEKSFKQMTFKEKLAYAREVVTVEPLIAGYLMAAILCGPALANLEFEKACRANLDMNDTVCEAILTGEHDNYSDVNQDIQTLIANMHTWQQPMQTFVPLILVLFFGSYSDRHKLRKPLLILPIVGEFFSVAGCILCVVWMKEWPLETLGVSQLVLPSFFGGQPMITMAVFAYIADVSSIEMRTLRVGVVQIVLNITVPVVQSFSGILFEHIGYIYIFLIAAALYMFCIAYGVFYIKEPNAPVDAEKKKLIVDLFDPRHAIDTVMIMFKRTKGNNRLLIHVTLLVLFVFSGVVVGESSVIYLYVQNNFHWTPVHFSYFVTTNTVVHSIGTFLGVPFFTKILHLDDIVILLITFVDKIVANIVFALAETAFALYAAVVVSVITGISSVAIRSLATKIVSENDLGKSQSLFGICEAVAPAAFIPIYNQAIYLLTYKSLPAAFFYFGVILYVFCCLILCSIYFYYRKKTKKHRNTDIDNNTTDKPIHMEHIQITHM